MRYFNNYTVRLVIVLLLSVLHVYASIYIRENGFNPTYLVMFFTVNIEIFEDEYLIAWVFQAILQSALIVLLGYLFVLHEYGKEIIKKTWVVPVVLSAGYRILVNPYEYDLRDYLYNSSIYDSFIGVFFNKETHYPPLELFVFLMGVTLIAMLYLVVLSIMEYMDSKRYVSES